MCQDIVTHKYLRRDYVPTVKHEETDSSVWANLLKVKKISIFRVGVLKFRMASPTCSWLNKNLLYLSVSNHFKLCRQQNISVSHVISDETQMASCTLMVDIDDAKSDGKTIVRYTL
jgi:hypothetical protein